MSSEMTQTEFADFMDEVYHDAIAFTRQAGQAEYAGGPDASAFDNFNRLAKELGVDRKQVLWVYAMKHKDGIASYLRGHESQREEITGRIMDLIVYLFLLWGMIQAEK